MLRNSNVASYPSPGRGHLDSMVELGKLITKHDPSVSIAIIIIHLPHEAHSIKSYTSKVYFANPSITFICLPPLSNRPSNRPSSPQEIIASFFEVPKLFNQRLCEALSVLSKSTNLKALVPSKDDAVGVFYLLKLAFSCLNVDPQSRPTTQQVAWELMKQWPPLNKPFSEINLEEIMIPGSVNGHFALDQD